MQHIPVYKQFIFFIKRGFAALNDEQQIEIREFIRSSQHENGAFTDRSGLADYYYSLFGTWLSIALGLVNILEKHKQFVVQTKRNYNNPVDELAALLIEASLWDKDFRKPSFLYLIKKTLIKPGGVSVVYRMFLFFLLVDALNERRKFNPIIRGGLFFVAPPSDSPCSIWAAYNVARHEAGFKVQKGKNTLFGFFEADKGFKAYRDIAEADLLSTAVALFALKSAGADLRKITPDCLGLIEQNYDGGAFLAGTGDKDRDLEYTFYGLMALGILV